jgi:YqxM protein
MANGDKDKERKGMKKEVVFKLIVVLTLLPLIISSFLAAQPPPVAVAQEEGPSSFGCPPDWDKSSLQISGACYKDDSSVKAEVCNVGDGDMADTTTYEVWYKASGNPKDGGIAPGGTGTVPALDSGECTTLSYTPSPCTAGNYMFKVYQRPKHPGTGVLWSEQCSLTCPPPVCQDVTPHEETTWGDWGECIEGWQTKEGTYHWWTTDNYTGEVCDETFEPVEDEQECWPEMCQEVDEHEKTEWNDWGECIEGWQEKTGTYYYWTTDKYRPNVICFQKEEPVTDKQECWPEVCEVVDTHGTKECGGWSECIDGIQWHECVVQTWTTDHYRPGVICGRESSTILEQRPCEVPEDRTQAGQVEPIFSCPVLEAYDPVNWNSNQGQPPGWILAIRSVSQRHNRQRGTGSLW